MIVAFCPLFKNIVFYYSLLADFVSKYAEQADQKPLSRDR
jgi:hypothetical protein